MRIKKVFTSEGAFGTPQVLSFLSMRVSEPLQLKIFVLSHDCLQLGETSTSNQIMERKLNNFAFGGDDLGRRRGDFHRSSEPPLLTLPDPHLPRFSD